MNKKIMAWTLAASSLGLFGGLASMPAHAASAPPVGTPVGSVSASGDPTTQSGAVVVQGNGTAPGPVGGGYIGVTSGEGVVACANGNYTGSGDNTVAHIPPTQQDLTNLQSAQSNPCTPAP